MKSAVAKGVVRISLLALAATMTLSLPAAAQRLWSVEEVATRPRLPGEAAAAVANAATALGGNPTIVEAATVQVNFDYLRLGMGYLELPLWDGYVIAAENAVFEDRGNGNFLWTGEVPGAGYESVLLTLQDGHLIGWFGEPGGPKHTVHAGPDGSGTVAVEEGPTGDWCGTETGRSDAPSPVNHVAPASASQVPAASSSDTLDVLILYTGRTERFWRPTGGAAVGVQQMEDYLNMVFRNGAIPTEAKLIPVRWEPVALSDPLTQAGHREPRYGACFVLDRGFLWPQAFWSSSEVDDLRRRYAVDAVYFVTSIKRLDDFNGGLFNGFAGVAQQQRNSLEPYVGFSWGTPDASVLAHELGHTLGGWHSPYEYYEIFGESEWQRALATAVRPYAFAHTDLASCGSTCPATVMVGASNESLDKRDKGRSSEPYFSSVRYRPNGWTIGVAGERENERVMQETVPAYLRNSDAGVSVGQLPRRLAARWVARDKVELTWPSAGELGGRWTMRLAAVNGENEVFHLVSRLGDLPVGSSENVVPIVEEGRVGAEIGGLRPGAAYKVSVVGPTRSLSEKHEWVSPLASDVLELKAPSVPRGAPVAPTQVSAYVTSPSSLRLTWSDNSHVETGHEIWYRRWSGDEPDLFWRHHPETMASNTRSAEIGGLVADEETQITYDSETKTLRGRYTFVVVAFNERGFSASDPFDVEFMPDAHPEATATGEISDCRLRDSGLELDGYVVHMCIETPDGTRRRAWDYGLAADRSGLLHFFGRDNVEVLVKVLDGCAINGHRWVFVAPVTTLAFQLSIREVGPGLSPWWWQYHREDWYYDSERRTQAELNSISSRGGSPQGRTARTVSDTTAFPCMAAEIAAAKERAANTTPGGQVSRQANDSPAAPLQPLRAGTGTDCEPGGPTLTLSGGYRVSMCYETETGETGAASDWGLESSRMGLLYFSDRDLVEALIKVRDDCAVGGNVSVSVAPATTAAFNLRVESPNGYVWRHSNRLGDTAEAVSDVSAFPCTGSSPETLVCTGVTCLLQGERFRVKAWYSKGGSPSQKAGAIAAALGASAGLFGGDSAGPELLVRVVNRCRTSGWWEVHGGVASDANFRFAIRDTKTNALKWFRSSGRSVVDAEAFACTESDFGAMAGGAPADPGASCTGATCLLRDRLFRVKSWYRLGSGSSGPAAAVSVDLDGFAGLYAFESGNPELLVRIADACSTTGYWTVYAGAASDAAFSVAIRNTGTNELKWFRSRDGGAIADTTAFACGGR